MKEHKFPLADTDELGGMTLTTDHGSTFTYDDIKFHIYTGYNVDDYNALDAFFQYESSNVKYKKIGKNYYVVSGMYNNNVIYYKKWTTYINSEGLSVEVCLTLFYPKEKQKQVESFITYISKWNKKA